MGGRLKPSQIGCLPASFLSGDWCFLSSCQGLFGSISYHCISDGSSRPDSPLFSELPFLFPNAAIFHLPHRLCVALFRKRVSRKDVHSKSRRRGLCRYSLYKTLLLLYFTYTISREWDEVAVVWDIAHYIDVYAWLLFFSTTFNMVLVLTLFFLIPKITFLFCPWEGVE